jgi:hypothetical protein
MESRLRRARDLPDVVLVAIAAPDMVDTFPPAIPDRLVGALVVGPPEDEPILRPDDRVGPVAAYFGQDLTYQWQLLAAHAAIDRAIGRGDQGSCPGADERLPGDRIEGVVGDPPAPRSALMTTVVAERDVVRRIGERHVGQPIAEDPGEIGWLGRIAAQEPMLAERPQVAPLRSGLLCRRFERLIEVEALRPFAPLTGLQ